MKMAPFLNEKLSRNLPLLRALRPFRGCVARSVPVLVALALAQQMKSSYLFDYRRLWELNFPDDSASSKHLHFIDCVVEAVRSQLEAIPTRNDYQANRYDTDDTMVLHVWAGGKSFDIILPRVTLTTLDTPAPSVPSGNVTGAEEAGKAIWRERIASGVKLGLCIGALKGLIPQVDTDVRTKIEDILREVES